MDNQEFIEILLNDGLDDSTIIDFVETQNDEIVELRAKLVAMESQTVPADKPARITEQDTMSILLEWDAYRAERSASGVTPSHFKRWMDDHGRTLLNKLNADREQVPAVAVPEDDPCAEDLDSQLLFFWSSAFWSEMLKKNPALSEETKSKLLEISNERDRNRAATQSHTQQSSATSIPQISTQFAISILQGSQCTWSQCTYGEGPHSRNLPPAIDLLFQSCSSHESKGE